MNLMDIVSRASPPEPWREGDNIPWNEPGFSQRMLKEHLSQEHDHASRRLESIDRHVAWIHAALLGGRSGRRILDLGCGPGLYGERLALLEHDYTGIDFSPASIEYARKTAQNRGLSCEYRLGDLRETVFGPDNSCDLVMQIFGEINVFRPAHARAILCKAFAALKPGGCLLLEVSTEASLRGSVPAAAGMTSAAGMTTAAGWYSSQGGLFSDRPHLILEETHWEEQGKTLTSRYFVIDAASCEVQRFASSLQVYTNQEYIQLVSECGFTAVSIQHGLAAESGGPPGDFLAILAKKPQP